MTIAEKISAARAYVEMVGATDEARNDAANIYASSYEDYLAIWNALEK